MQAPAARKPKILRTAYISHHGVQGKAGTDRQMGEVNVYVRNA